eukprot:5665331-Prorocentrum_lima.AAC.1
METLLAVNGSDPASQQRFYSLMESMFGQEWKACNTLKQLSTDSWGGRWICQTCNITPTGTDQLIAH